MEVGSGKYDTTEKLLTIITIDYNRPDKTETLQLGWGELSGWRGSYTFQTCKEAVEKAGKKKAIDSE